MLYMFTFVKGNTFSFIMHVSFYDCLANKHHQILFSNTTSAHKITVQNYLKIHYIYSNHILINPDELIIGFVAYFLHSCD